jgi:hypothetical protein
MSITTSPESTTDTVILEALTQHLSSEASGRRRSWWRSPAAIRIAVIAVILGS